MQNSTPNQYNKSIVSHSHTISHNFTLEVYHYCSFDSLLVKLVIGGTRRIFIEIFVWNGSNGKINPLLLGLASLGRFLSSR